VVSPNRIETNATAVVARGAKRPSGTPKRARPVGKRHDALPEAQDAAGHLAEARHARQNHARLPGKRQPQTLADVLKALGVASIDDIPSSALVDRHQLAVLLTARGFSTTHVARNLGIDRAWPGIPEMGHLQRAL
jgi:hypothetical protein